MIFQARHPLARQAELIRTEICVVVVIFVLFLFGFIWFIITLQIVLVPPPWPKDSALRFEIALWEGSQNIDQTHTRT